MKQVDEQKIKLRKWQFQWPINSSSEDFFCLKTFLRTHPRDPKIGNPHFVIGMYVRHFATMLKSRPENPFASSSLTVDAFSDFDFSRCFCFPHAINLGKTNGKNCDKVATEMRKYHTIAACYFFFVVKSPFLKELSSAEFKGKLFCDRCHLFRACQPLCGKHRLFPSTFLP